MNLLTILVITAVIFALWYMRLPVMSWLFIWPVAVYAYIRFGITPPVPGSVLTLYVNLTILGVLAFILADTERFKQVSGQFTSFICDKKHAMALYTVVALLPIAYAAKIYMDMTVEVKAPTFGRTIHPAPPNTVDFKGKTIDLLKGKNPYRELEQSDKAAFAAHVENGRTVYVQNCIYCHGDDLRGDGMFAHGFNPVPANFNSATTIAMLQEAYLFWRIAKGGPGLPDESGPWSSSMPAWEKFLSEEQIWDVILYLYDHTGYTPRAEEEHH